MLTDEIAHRDLSNDAWRKLELIVTEIQLFGSEEQVKMAQSLAYEVAAKTVFELDPLINNLRNSLREQLELSEISGNVTWLRYTPYEKKENKIENLIYKVLSNLKFKMDRSQESFYMNLGLLATLFARVESQVRSLVVLEIHPANVMVGYQTLEGNPLEKNLRLLMSINKHTNFETERIKSIVSRVDKVKSLRNQFIHGNWGIPFEKDGEIRIEIHISKIGTLKIGSGDMLVNATPTIYTLNQIQDQIIELRSISSELVDLYQLIEVRVFGH